MKKIFRMILKAVSIITCIVVFLGIIFLGEVKSPPELLLKWEAREFENHEMNAEFLVFDEEEETMKWVKYVIVFPENYPVFWIERHTYLQSNGNGGFLRSFRIGFLKNSLLRRTKENGKNDEGKIEIKKPTINL